MSTARPRPTLVLLLSAGLLVACDPDPGAAGPEAPAGQEDDAEERASAREKVQRRLGRLRSDRELSAVAIDAALGERLAAGRLLRVDAAVPSDAFQVRYALVAGDLEAPPADIDALDGEGEVRRTLLGGEDAARPVILHNVDEGRYTVCVAASPPIDAETAAVHARAVAAYEAAGGGELTADKLMAAVATARAETGYVRKEIDWSARPVRCVGVEVTADPMSRMVALARE